MSNPDVLEKTPLSIVELKKELNAIKKRDGELNFRASRTEEYVNDFARFSVKDADAFAKKLRDLDLPRLKDEHIKKIIDIVPANEKHLKLILSGYTLTVSADNMKKIMSVVKEFTPKK